MKKRETLEQEASKFVKSRKVRLPKEKPLTLREYRIGQALSGILSRTQGFLTDEDIKEMIEAAEKIADMMD